MKKYLIAAAVAVMAFGFSAFAASLTVNAGTLQTGQAMGLTCASEANVAAWGYKDSPLPVEVDYVKIAVVDDECDNGENLHVILLKADGSELARGGPAGGVDMNGDGEYLVDFSNVHPADVKGIRIGIDQGHQDYDYTLAP